MGGRKAVDAEGEVSHSYFLKSYLGLQNNKLELWKKEMDQNLVLFQQQTRQQAEESRRQAQQQMQMFAMAFGGGNNSLNSLFGTTPAMGSCNNVGASQPNNGNENNGNNYQLIIRVMP